MLFLKLLNILVNSIFFGTPILTVVFFISSLYRYIKARKTNQKLPGTFSSEEMKKRVVRLVVSSIMMGVLVVIVIGIIWLLSMPIAFM